MPRSGFQEVTAVMAALPYLPVGWFLKTVVVDAQVEELRAVLCVMYPKVIVVQVLRNSTAEHARADTLAREARYAISPPRPAVSSVQSPGVAVLTMSSVDQEAPVFAVAFWFEGKVQTVVDSVARQQTRTLTSRVLRAASQQVIPAGYALVLAQDANRRSVDPEWGASGPQLATLRRAAAAAMKAQLALR
ncbi:hypothetical protein EHF33_15455 [Deinococcus psychrotolerans]|uniref:Uncharacterized protein n=1 Tax=Deinococcus psychrotolerans TaxID=2489213 RepID=A0A3G8YH52_9DEIO|nr:hypothetical protein [Deinococcus psychrotolerans]AZI44285.1 hypothetical protein EHF33_15455 [Deinococcus psychrotolerans]